ncbi:hypothetical protein Tco_1183247 [Tanacetum coccineum]
MPESLFVNSGFAVLVFSLEDDPIACLNKAMAFLTVVASSRFPSTNNQLITSFNPRNQAIIQDDRVIVQQVQGRQGQNYSGTAYKNNATSSRGNTASGIARVVKCYNCQEAKEARQILDEEQLAFLVDPGIPASQAQTVIPYNAAFQTEDLDTYDSDCEVPNSETYLNDMDNQSVHALQDFKQSPVMDITDNEISRKEIVENVVHIPSANTIASGMFNLNLEPLPPRLLQNREVHIDYLRNTQEQVNILREIVKQAKEKQPLDGELDLACKYTTRIQELLVYVQDTCPNAITPNTWKVAVTPMNNVKKVRFVEPLTSSSNNKQVESSNTSDSSTPVLSSTGVKCSTRNSRSKPLGNKKNDRISQTPSKNKKNKVEAQPRKVNNSNRVVKPICDVDVKLFYVNTNLINSLLVLANKSMFAACFM